jgi:hypothetical protein
LTWQLDNPPVSFAKLVQITFFCSFGNVIERGKDLISTIREFIVLTLYFEVALIMTRVTLRQNSKEIKGDELLPSEVRLELGPVMSIIYH